jgi:hypothetical protein
MSSLAATIVDVLSARADMRRPSRWPWKAGRTEGSGSGSGSDAPSSFVPSSDSAAADALAGSGAAASSVASPAADVLLVSSLFR